MLSILELFIFCVLSSFFCCGLFVAFNGPNMILKPVAQWLDFNCIEILKKPLYECLMCMSSIWTVFLWTLFVQKFSFNIIIAIVVVCGMNSVLAYRIKKLLASYE